MADFTVELNGPLFKRQYLLYVIQLSHGPSDYYYVGQTGDTKEKTARPVFRRLTAHLEDRKSTQNQVYQYIAHHILHCPVCEGKDTAFTGQTRQRVEKYLVNSDVTMSAYRLEDFSQIITKTKHHEIRRRTLQIEKQVIDILRKNKRKVINKKSTGGKPYYPCPYPEIIIQVKNDFLLK